MDEDSNLVTVRSTIDNSVLLEVNTTFVDDQKYTAFIFGSAANPQIFFATDKKTRAPLEEVEIRFVNISSSFPLVDGYVTGHNTDINGKDPRVVNLSSPGVTSYRRYDLDDGEFRIRTAISGTVSLVGDTGDEDLDERNVYTAVLFEPPSGQSSSEMLLLQDQ